MYKRLVNTESLSLIFIIAGSALLMFFCIHEGHNWSGDYALYIEQTQAILNGSVDRLYTLSKYSNDHAYRVQGAYLYPMGFPILMVVPYYFMGLNFIALKIFCGLFFLCSLPLFYKVFRPYFSNAFYPLCIVLAIAFHHEYIVFSDNVYSDFPFFFFSALTFLQLRKENTLSNQLLLGGLIFFSYYIRDVGIVFLPVLVVYQLQLRATKKLSDSKRWFYLIPYVVFVVFYMVNAALLPKGTANHYAHLWSKLSWKLILKNSIFYVDLISSYFFLAKQMLLVLLIPFLVGVFSVRKQQLHFAVYIFLVLAVYIIWPAWQGMRFVFPILPVIIYFIVKGLEQITIIANVRQRYLALALGSSLCILSYLSLQRIIAFNRTDTNLAYNKETKRMYEYISKNIPYDEIIGFEKPRVLRLFTGRNSILSDLPHFEDIPLSYLLIRTEDISADTKIPYETIYKTEKLILVHR